MADPRSRGAGVPQWAVRPARASDAASLAAVNAAASTAPADRAEGTSGVSPSEIGPFARLLEPRTGLVYVAEGGGSIVGYLALQRAAHPAVTGRSPIQLWQLYVIPAFQGSGVAAQLMSAGDRASRRLESTRSAPQVTLIGTSSCRAPCPEVSRTCHDDEVCPAHAAQDPA